MERSVKNDNTGLISQLLELGKIRITFAVAITTAIGYLLKDLSFDLTLLIVSVGVLLLGMGSAAFNHWQERDLDKLMERTKNRPIPSGNMPSEIAFAIAGILSVLGLMMILFSSGFTAMLLGLGTLILYNIIYTPLKRVTTLAVVPGAFVGAIPPIIGWVAAGGYVFAPAIWTMAIFIFIWQMPHFWLLLLLFDKQYKFAGYPVLTDWIDEKQLSRITFIWIVALATMSVIIPFYGLLNNIWILLTFAIAQLWVIFDSRYLLRSDLSKKNIFRSFRNINFYVLLVLILIIIDKTI